MRVGLLGGSGQIGSELIRQFAEIGWEVDAPSSRQVDIRDQASLEAWFRGADFGYVVNCAAYTAVDEAERQTALANAINGQGAGNVARAANQFGLPLIYLSTDYVFSGAQSAGYHEGDATAPINAYGSSKLLGEQLTEKYCSRATTLRVSWVFGVDGHNFVKAILNKAIQDGRLRVVNDQHGAPTSARSIALLIVKVIALGDDWRSGIYHFSSRPRTTWFDFACEIISTARSCNMVGEVEVAAIATSAITQLARRPVYSHLITERLEAVLPGTVSCWKDELEHVVGVLSES